jgi:carbamoyl-phosphate synthase large subunit
VSDDESAAGGNQRSRTGAGPNVLIVAAGRRTSLVRAFVDQTRPLGGLTLAADTDGLAPALSLADRAIRLPRTDATGYLEHLLNVVEQERIDLLVPTIDTDLPVIAENRAHFTDLGCLPAIPDLAFVRIAMDKFATVSAFGGRGIATPASWLPDGECDGLPDRLFVKPRRGSASQHAYRTALADLAAILALVPDPIIQEELIGPEITIDALLDFAGRPIQYVPRLRIRTLAGESVQGVTLDHDPALEQWLEHTLELAGVLGAAGPLTLQAFLTERGPVLSEINARFGGGFPLALAAGGNYPALLLDMAAGRDVASRLGQWDAGLYMTRYHVEHFTRAPAW